MEDFMLSLGDRGFNPLFVEAAILRRRLEGKGGPFIGCFNPLFVEAAILRRRKK